MVHDGFLPSTGTRTGTRGAVGADSEPPGSLPRCVRPAAACGGVVALPLAHASENRRVARHGERGESKRRSRSPPLQRLVRVRSGHDKARRAANAGWVILCPRVPRTPGASATRLKSSRSRLVVGLEGEWQCDVEPVYGVPSPAERGQRGLARHGAKRRSPQRSHYGLR
jgi:hypothetical protein